MSFLPFSELQSVVLLNRLTLAGGSSIQALLQEGHAPSEIVRRIRDENWLGKSEKLKEILKTFHPERELEQCEKKGIRCLSIFDSGYPDILKQIFDPPILLYVKGDLLESDEAALAIVGSRHPSFYGREQAKQFSRELAESGLTIISGLARGIDQVAHEAALQVKYARSIGILGSGLDEIYPRENQKLYEALVERGAVISEYALGTKPMAHHFPRRNRIISGLSLAVLVIEAHSRSGSLITAHEAVEQGKDVFALPGPVDQLTSRGTHRLIKEGAYLVENSSDILEVLAAQLWPFIGKGIEQRGRGVTEKAMTEDVGEEEQSVVNILRQGPLRFEQIVRNLNSSFGKTSAMLLKLELRKKIVKKSDQTFTLVS